LVELLNSGITTAQAKRAEAATLRQSAWASSEAALFTNIGKAAS
jgi:hypothetical protein